MKPIEYTCATMPTPCVAWSAFDDQPVSARFVENACFCCSRPPQATTLNAANRLGLGLGPTCCSPSFVDLASAAYPARLSRWQLSI